MSDPGKPSTPQSPVDPTASPFGDAAGARPASPVDPTASPFGDAAGARPASPVEIIKAKSDHLRGTLAHGLVDPITGAIAPDDTQLIKFHGSYQQDDRDVREERRLQKLEPDWTFMLRTRLPGGVCTPAQWLVLDDLATRYGNGTLRATTRQAFQLHGVIKTELRPTLAAMNAAVVDSIAACGDVNRNVMCNPLPAESAAHADVYAWAVRLSEHLKPRTRAYYEIWLGEERVAGGEPKPGAGGEPLEPIYGATYLPRKFKAAIAVPPYNDVDVLSNDFGAIAIVEHGAVVGFDIAVGGGMGATHGEPETFPRLADVIGFATPDQLLAVAEQVVKIQRDFGDRTNRKHARLKYTIADRGIAWFVGELTARLGYALAPARPYAFTHNGDRYGWLDHAGGGASVTLHIAAGRIAGRARDGLREIARVHSGDFRLTPNQNVIIANIAAGDRARIAALLAAYGLDSFERASPVRLRALACVALPTCALAMAEAERYLPTLITRLEERLAAHGLAGTDLHVRMTGCPNGCARPSLAEIALIGKAPGRYNLMLGGDRVGERLNRLYRENLDESQILAALDPLFADYAARRSPSESFGDFFQRTSSK